MTLPTNLQRLVELFAASPKAIKVQALVDYANRLPDPPEHLRSGSLQRVHECQTPFSVAVELDADRRVQLHFEVPRESPTMRGYAGILAEGLNGSTVDEVMAVSPTFYTAMGLDEVVTPLRLRGMSAIIARIRSLIREQLADVPGA
jgi:cysteine desulfuration protein SufE